MSSIEKIKKAIEAAKPISWQDLEDVFCKDRRTIRKWINDNCPQIKIANFQRDLTPAQAKVVLNEWME